MVKQVNCPDPRYVHFDVNTRERLRFAYLEAMALPDMGEQEETPVIMFEGKPFLLSYTKYLLEYLDMKLPEAKTWISPAPTVCDITGDKIKDEFYDSRLATGTAWAIMTPASWREFGPKVTGTGHGQRYKKRADGRFVKIEG